MIIRTVTITSLVLLLILVLYLPSAHPPERFLSQLRVEHELNTKFWGEQHAVRILSRMLDLQADATQAAPVPASFSSSTAPNQVNNAVATEVSQISTRLFNNQYFKSINTLFALATYRFSALIEWLPFLSVFIIAAIFDGFVRRIVKSKEFLQHNPELFALHISMIILIACGTVVAFVVPVTIHPIALVLAPFISGVFGSLAIANFHYRG